MKIFNNRFRYELLICPYCGGKFKPTINSLVCDCDEFPLINNILILDKSKAKKIVNYMRSGKFYKAINYALGWKKRGMILGTLLLLAKYKVYPRLLWGYKKNEWNYYLNRSEEKENSLYSFPMWVKNQVIRVWVDIGSGFGITIKKIIKKSSSFRIYSIDNSFNNILLNSLMSGDKRISYIYADMSVVGSFFKNKSVDVVTMIDVLPFIENQKNIVKSLTSGMLTKNGLVIISSVTEHVYIDELENYFPIYHEVLSSFFTSKCLVLDESRFLQGDKIESCLLNKNNRPVFRYLVVWPRFKAFSIKIKGKTIWSVGKIRWSNQVY